MLPAEALATHAMSKAGKPQAGMGQDDAAQLAAATIALCGVVKTARGLKKRGHALKRLDKARKKVQKGMGHGVGTAGAEAPPATQATGTKGSKNSKKKKKRKMKE